MRQPNKNRSRKNNRSNNNNNHGKNVGNVTNRVYDSSGPEGKVRGTPSQIVEKYQALARDAQLSGDRVNAENFLQHSEHYARLLADAQRQIDAQNAKREAEQAERAARDAERDAANQDDRQQDRQQDRQDERSAETRNGAQANGHDDTHADEADQPILVDTPEQQDQPKPRRTRSRRSNRSGGGDEAQAQPEAAAEG